ncbi:hypothetical protein RhiJN_25754 [Ceratobasidium sp. AG-Ba]|nr:hypothetical protein RhiJN_11625 [Ceratobasidium sp. AG-Ba]QRV97735.1 hypothetical protein RhiJN_25754 [Ceratobasidium sp. AG-Ba]QRW05976.1 hypothetical protein RhiLY_04975 [Ceratobasidium sp. AG-Ba]
MAPYTTSTSSAASSQTAMELPCDSQTPMMASMNSSPVSQPKPARTSKPKALGDKQAMGNEIDNFFGAPSPGVKKPKASVPKQSAKGDAEVYAHTKSASQGTLTPPAYEVPEHLAPTPKPMTIARYLFFYGFLFPPFWAIGACILLSPLQVDDSIPKDVEAGYAPKSDAYQKAELRLARQTELVYAKRCLLSLIAFLVIVVIVIVATRVAHVGAFA